MDIPATDVRPHFYLITNDNDMMMMRMQSEF